MLDADLARAGGGTIARGKECTPGLGPAPPAPTPGRRIWSLLIDDTIGGFVKGFLGEAIPTMGGGSEEALGAEERAWFWLGDKGGGRADPTKAAFIAKAEGVGSDT